MRLRIYVLLVCLLVFSVSVLTGSAQRRQTGAHAGTVGGTGRELKGQGRRGGGGREREGGGGGRRGNGGGTGGGGGGGDIMGPSRRIILLVLRQRCQYWLSIGVRNLPTYCQQFLRGQAATMTTTDLMSAYNHYRTVVTDEEQASDQRIAMTQAQDAPL